MVMLLPLVTLCYHQIILRCRCFHSFHNHYAADGYILLESGHITLPLVPPVTAWLHYVTSASTLLQDSHNKLPPDTPFCDKVTQRYRWLHSVPHGLDCAISDYNLFQLSRSHYATAGYTLLQPGYTLLQPGYTVFPRSTLLQLDFNVLPLVRLCST